MLKATPGTCAVKRHRLDGTMELETDCLTEEAAIKRMLRLNAGRRDPYTDDLFTVVTDQGLGTGPRVIDPQFGLAQLRYQHQLKQR